MFYRQWKIKIALLFAVLVSPSRPIVNTGGRDGDLNQTTFINKTKLPWLYDVPNTIALGECVIGILANSCLIFVLYKDPLKNLRKFSWLTICNLAFADLLTSICSIPFGIKEVLLRRGKGLYVANCFLYIGYSSSFFLLLLFATERYIAVKYPLQSRSILTKSKIIAACLFCWVAAILMGALEFLPLAFKEAEGPKIFIAQFFVLEAVTVVLIVLKVLILRGIKKNSQCTSINHAERKGQRKQIAITLVVLIVILLVTAFPYFIAKQLEFFRRLDRPAFRGTIVREFPYYFFPVACLNFIVNPFIYAFRLHDYRDAFLALFWAKEKIEFSSYSMQQTDTLVSTNCI